MPKKTARALLDIEDNTVVPIIRDPQKVTEESEAVFYFPGCGSERLFGQVGLATQALLYHVGSLCVMPPGYLCCGYPQTASGRRDQGGVVLLAWRSWHDGQPFMGCPRRITGPPHEREGNTT